MPPNGKVKIERAEPAARSENEKLRQKIAKTKEQAPTVRDQTGGFIQWNNLGKELGQPFDVEKIPLSKLYQMRRDPMIGFALHYIIAPLIKAEWWIECEDAQVAAYLDNTLREILGRFIYQYCLSLSFGWQSIVQRFQLAQPDWTYQDGDVTKDVWPEKNIDAIIYKPFVPLKPDFVEPVFTPSGEFNGMEYSAIGNYGFPFQKKEKEDTLKIDVEHSLWIVNEKDSVFGSLWGYPRIGYAYRYWWTYWYNWALADRHFEKDADPPTIVYYPEDKGVNEETGEVVDYRDVALQVGQDARSGSTVALPGTTVAGWDDRPTQLREWEIKYIEGAKNFEAFNQRFEYLDVLKLRSLWVPEQAFLEGKGGTSSRNVAHELIDAFLSSQAVLMREIDDVINTLLLPTIQRINFPDRKVRAKKRTKGFGSEDLEFVKQIIETVVTADPAKTPLNLRDGLERLGVPLLTPEDQAIKEQKLLEEQALAAPQPVPSVPGGPAEVSQTGFYIQMPELIRLSSKDRPKGFVPIIQQVEVEHVPTDIPGAKACFDDESATVYFEKGLSLEEKSRYLQQLHERLKTEVPEAEQNS